jgi:hypothetical protein
MGTTKYIDNEAFLRALILYRKEVKVAKKSKTEKPPLSDEIGLCFLKIADHLSRKPCFVAYSFREEMISDAVENCIQYVDNFDPERSQNPFSYFTQIIYFAFLRRIAKEKKQLYIKYKATELFNLTNDNPLHGNNDDAGLNQPIYENITEFIHTYEKTREDKKKLQKKKAKKLKGLDKFLE